VLFRSKAATYATDFHDVTVGSNYAGSATAGYDKVTGLGSPVASAIVSAAASSAATASAVAPAVEVREVLLVRFVLQNTADPDNTTGSSNVSTVIVATVTIVVNTHSNVDQTVVGALTSSTGSTSVQAASTSFVATASNVAGRALPNQSATVRTHALAASPDAREAVVINIEALPSTAAPSDAPSTPERGDFLPPARLGPATPIEIWDEALTRIGEEGEAGAVEPAPFEPWTAFEDAEEDLSEAAPTLLGAAGLAAVFWMGWNRRQSSDDDRRHRPSFIPSPSDN